MSAALMIAAAAPERTEPSRREARTNVPADLLAVHAEVAQAKHLWRMALTKVDGPSNAYRVGLHLIDTCLNTKTGRCFPKQETVARATGMDRRAVRYGLKKLKDLGLIYTQKRSYTGPNDILFYIPAGLRSDTAVAVQGGREVTQPWRTNRHGGGGGSDTVVADYNHRRNHRRQTTETGDSAGDVAPSAVLADTSSLRSEDISCRRTAFDIDIDHWKEGGKLL